MSLNLPSTLIPGDATGRQLALQQLRAYFAPQQAGRSGANLVLDGYTGGQWDTFDPSGTKASRTNVFTTDDIVACSLLAVEIGGNAALQLLGDPRYAELLSAIGPDREFAELESLDCDCFHAVRALYRALVDLPGVRETKATKMLARKRPHLVPIVDSVVRATVFTGVDRQWATVHEALRADDMALHRHLLDLHAAADLHPDVSALRVFDVLAWMAGKGYER